MNIEQLVKGNIYYVHSAASGRSYIFRFLDIRSDILVSSSDRPLEKGAVAFYRPNTLITISHIDKLRPATPKEMAYLAEKIGFDTLVQNPNVPNKPRLIIHKNLKLNFKL